MPIINNYLIDLLIDRWIVLQVQDWQSIYQSTAIPIPRFPPVDNSVNFVGRLAREIIRITDPRCDVNKIPNVVFNGFQGVCYVC